jgi:phospholipid/cholesterol/gamma-HCH transport system permease protein
MYLISVTGAFTGMVLTLQMNTAVSSYGAQSAIGGSVAVSLSRELAPVLSALLLTGRAGSAMTGELGAMRMTEQVDALTSMAVAPVQYLVVPRIVASVLVMPMLALIYGVCGMLGGYLVWIYQMGLDGTVYINSIHNYFDLNDLTHGLIKALVFGLLISVVCCSRGLFASGGSRGVGLATTRAVVVSSFLILASDYIITLIIT